MTKSSTAPPSFSKVRRMGAVHPHARITKRRTMHRADMRASCDSIETATVPLSVLFLMIVFVRAAKTKRWMTKSSTAPPSFSKVRRMGTAHPHARITRRRTTHRASMRASCDSIEIALLPLSFFLCIFIKCHRGVAPVPL